MQNFAFARHEKIHDLGWGDDGAGGCVGRWCHDLRLIETPNADRSLDVLVATKDTNWELQRLSEAKLRDQFLQKEHLAYLACRRLSDLGISRWRKGSVLVEQVLVGLSPEYVRDGDERLPENPQKIAQARKAVLSCYRRKYADNLLAIVEHGDESNTHWSAYIVPAVYQTIRRRGRPRKAPKVTPAAGPIKRQGWTLCAKKMFSPAACSKAQTDFAEACRENGLDVRRGVKGSRTPHATMRAHLALVHAPTEAVQHIAVPEPKGFWESKEAFAQRVRVETSDQIERANAQLTGYYSKALEYDREVTLRKSYEQAAADAQATTQKLQSKIHDLESEIGALKKAARESANRVRDIDLSLVARALGYTPDTTREGCFRTPMGDLVVGPAKFTLGSSARGRNAVDLVKACTSGDFATAVRWLLATFPEQVQGATAAHISHSCESRMQAALRAGPLSIEEQIELLAPATPAQWPSVLRAMKSAVGDIDEVARGARTSGLVEASSGSAVRVNLYLPEIGNVRTGAAVLSARDLLTKQIVGSGCAVLRPTDSPATVTIAESYAEALALAEVQPSRVNILVPFARQWSPAFWQWIVDNVQRVDFAAVRGRLDWIVSSAEAAFHASGRLFDGLLDALFTHVQPQTGAWVSELKTQRSLGNLNQIEPAAHPIRVR